MKCSSYLNRMKEKMVKKLLYFILTKIFRKEAETVAVIYATLIVKGKKTFEQVPEKIREQVREVLIDLEVPELAE